MGSWKNLYEKIYRTDSPWTAGLISQVSSDLEFLLQFCVIVLNIAVLVDLQDCVFISRVV